jgi:hypothetical protein
MPADWRSIPPPAELPSQEPGWRERGACRGFTALFFPDDSGSGTAALAICATCPVITSCRSWALLESGEGPGIIGGLTENQRRLYRRRYRREVSSPPSVEAVLNKLWPRYAAAM